MSYENLNTKENFENIMRNYYSRLLSFVKNIVRNDAIAQDITQETFISAYNSYDKYSEQGKVFAWLKIIARNTAYRHMQKESKHICLSGSEINLAGYISDDALLEDGYIADEGYRYILGVINKLPEHQRAVFYYRYVNGMPVSEIAAKLNLPHGSVKSKAHYGLVKVKLELKNYLIEGEYIMNCQKAYEYLYQYAKDAILAEDKSNVEQHLAACNKCKDIAESLKKLIPQIKPAPEGMMRHYSITFQVDDGMILVYFGMMTHVHDYKKLNDRLAATGGVIPEGEVWFHIGFGSEIKHLAEFDNEGNRVEVDIYDSDLKNHMSMRYTKMKKVFEYHQANSVSLLEATCGDYTKSHDAPNLFIAKTRNNLGQNARSGLYIAIPGKAKNVRMKQGVDVLHCGAFQFAYDDRYVTENQYVSIECTYNL